VKAGWAIKKLCEVADVQSGGTPLVHNKPYWNGDIAWYSSGELNDLHSSAPERHISKAGLENSNAKLFPSGSLLIGMYDTAALKMSILDRPAAFNQAIAGVRPNEQVDLVFILHAINAIKDEILERRRGVRQKNLSLGKIKDIELPMPPLPEQRRIVGILDEAFEGIATAKANAEKNLENARALFESHLQSVFTQRGNHPVVPIGEVSEVFDGPHATPKTVDTGPVFLGIGALQDGRVNLGETRHVTPEDFLRWTRRVRPQADDVVFSYETRLGQAAIVPAGLECCLGRRMGLVRVDQRRVSPHFFVYQYISPPFREFLNSRTVRGATVDRISLKEFPSFSITLPPLPEQNRIADQLDGLRAETERLASIYQQKLAALDELKKSLLHQAFSGEL
jgi:type I restriction enzyme S subunit